MLKYFNVHSLARPANIEVTDSKVLVVKRLIDYTTNNLQGYEYDLEIYDKNEYIQLLSEQNKELQTTLLDTQQVLCDIYESLGGF